MLPDIDTPNKRFSVSGLGAYEGHGILSRSFEDLHPQPDLYEVVWNGSIEAQIQKAEQRSAPGPHTLTMLERAESYAQSLSAIIREAGTALSAGQVSAQSPLNRDTVDTALRKMANRGELSVCDEFRHVGLTGARRLVHVYSLPKKARKDEAA
jgi:hypothetical protein